MSGPQRLRVRYLDHCAQLSGGEIALLRLLPALHADVDATVVLAEDGPLVERLRQHGVHVVVRGVDKRALAVRKEQVRSRAVGVGVLLAWVGQTLRLARELRQDPPDLIHTNSLKAALYGGVAGRLARVPVVWHIRDRIAEDYLPPAAVRLIRSATRCLPAAVIANSSATLATLPVASRGRPFVVVHDCAEAAAEPARVARDSTEFVVGVLGRLAPWKGQDVFLRAFARAFGGSAVRAHLIGAPLFGEAEYAGRLRQLADELGIDSQVDFRGFRGDVPGELALLDVLVHCSTVPEPFGQVIVEALAAGVPVIAAAEGGPLEVLTHDHDGLLVPPRDPELLADALVALASDPARRERLAQAGLRTAATFTPTHTAAHVLALYRRVLERRRRLPSAGPT